MNVKNLSKISIILIAVIAFGCRKELYNLAAEDPNNDLKKIQKGFVEKDYQAKLIQRLNDTISINWKVEWNSASKTRAKDSLTYVFFNLKPYSYNPKNPAIEKPVTELYTKRFLIVGKGLAKNYYRLATYYYDQAKDSENRLSNGRFSGIVIYKNLDLNTSNLTEFKEGVPVVNSVSRNSQKKMSVNQTASDCYYRHDCTFYMVCNGTPIIARTSQKDFCREPSPMSDCFGNTWILTDDSMTEICDNDLPDPGVPGGGTPGSPTDPAVIPCPGDPVKVTRVAKSSATNVNGGRMGYTRRLPDNSTKYHGGLDIFAEVNTPLFPVYAGQIKRIERQYAPGEYVSARSFGNLIEIESTLPDGSKLLTLYAHLNSVPANLAPLQSVNISTNIGRTGRTGNAAHNTLGEMHVHIQMKKNGVPINPELYLRTKFADNGSPIYSPCN
jgi:murein DD-endopeptidase MepM/ murein hydrolase activator NlpD